MKTPERQGLEHPHRGVATHNQTALHTKQHTQKTVFQDSERLSCLFLLLVTRATLAQSSTPSPPHARFTLLPHSQDPLDTSQWHIKFIPPHAASQQALDSNWRSPGLKEVFVPKIHPKVGFACVGYISISRGKVQRGPSFHSYTTLPPPLTGMEAFIPSHSLACMKQGSPPFTPEMSFFSCPHCLHVNVMNHTLLSEFLSENEERGDNARLNKHSDN